MSTQEQFAWFCVQNAIAHAPSALAAWNQQQALIDKLRAEVMTLQESNEHLHQQLYEAEQRKLRLVHSAA